jgi:hypothetical protein
MVRKRVTVKTEKNRVSVHEHFKSLTHLIDTMEQRPVNKAFEKEDDLSSQRDETKKENPWSGTKTYNDAMEIIKAGYYEPLERMKKAIINLGKKEPNSRPKLKNDFVGFTPHVPNTLMNLPITMINKEKRPNKPKTIHLIYNFGASAKTTPDEMITGGINFISLVNSLEKQGYSVKIDLISSFGTDKTLSSMTVNVKGYGQKVNLLKLTFPLVHPSMLRRVSFKWLETTPGLKDKDFTFGYGIPLQHLMKYDLESESNYLKSLHVIKGDNTYYCNMNTAIKSKSPEDLAKRLGILE